MSLCNQSSHLHKTYSFSITITSTNNQIHSSNPTSTRYISTRSNKTNLKMVCTIQHGGPKNDLPSPPPSPARHHLEMVLGPARLGRPRSPPNDPPTPPASPPRRCLHIQHDPIRPTTPPGSEPYGDVDGRLSVFGDFPDLPRIGPIRPETPPPPSRPLRVESA